MARAARSASRYVALLAFALPLGIVSSSCRSIVGDDDVAAAAALCALLNDCYDGAFDCSAMDAAMTGASQDTVNAFLVGFDESDCLQSCAGGRVCVNTQPFCGGGASDCTRDESCCGWSLGAARCEEGKCCEADGQPCADAGDCCSGVCEGTCGGVACKAVKEACRFSFDCCSNNCVEEKCAPIDCSANFEPCQSNDECCPVVDDAGVVSSSGPRAECSGGVCKIVGDACFEAGEACNYAYPVEPGGGCCNDFDCVLAPGFNQGRCVGDCLSTGLDCNSDSDCCGDLICHLEQLVATCGPAPSECDKAGAICEQNSDCCSGACSQSTCLQSDGIACELLAGSCHSPCVVGGVLREADCPEWNDSVGEVNELDPFCFCTGWDEICVATYKALTPGVGCD